MSHKKVQQLLVLSYKKNQQGKNDEHKLFIWVFFRIEFLNISSEL